MPEIQSGQQFVMQVEALRQGNENITDPVGLKCRIVLKPTVEELSQADNNTLKALALAMMRYAIEQEIKQRE